MTHQLIRIGIIARKLGNCSESNVWRMFAADPAAPQPIKLSHRHTVFDEAEVDGWIERRIKAARANPVKSVRPDAEAIRRGAATRKAKREAQHADRA